MRLARAFLLLLLTLPAAAQTQQAIEQNLGTPVPIEGVSGPTLEQRMKELGVAAISYAVVEDGRVVLAAARGLADIESGRRATTSTLFQAASISKPVTAMAVMDLVERGQLPLEAPVNSLLRTWKLPDNELTAKTPVTLRMLLSHSGGTTVHGFPGYATDQKLPTLIEILNGTPPANTTAIVVDLPPNTRQRYSGGGIEVVQQVLHDQFATPFPELMRRTVLAPLGMRRSTYEQPLPRARRDEAATAYRLGPTELRGKWHIYPENAAAGLWTTPAELAQTIIEMQDALAGRPTRVLSTDAAWHMLKRRFPPGDIPPIGIGFFLEEHDGVPYFSHGGYNEGFLSQLMATRDGRQGAVVMTNSDGGSILLWDLLAAIAREYRWPGFSPKPLHPVSVSAAEADRVIGRYESESGEVISIRRRGDALQVLDVTTGWHTLYAIEGGLFARNDRNVRYAKEGDALLVIENEKRTTAHALPADAPIRADELLGERRLEEALAAYRAEFAAGRLPERVLDERAAAMIEAARPAEALALFGLNAELYSNRRRRKRGWRAATSIRGRTRARSPRTSSRCSGSTPTRASTPRRRARCAAG
ncbi:MAG TPA: serine hydrolase domain-containing protein [Thermoanaerobaculia bacterium]|jgi:CubicO group peptidase (beta-lactamase class C family)